MRFIKLFVNLQRKIEELKELMPRFVFQIKNKDPNKTELQYVVEKYIDGNFEGIMKLKLLDLKLINI